MSIRLRVTLWFLMLLATLMIARSVFIVGAMQKVLHDDALADAQGRASQVRDFIEDLSLERRSEGNPPLSLSDPEALPRAFFDDGMCIQLCDAKGRIIQRSANLGALKLPVLMRRAHRTIALPLPHLFLSSKAMLAAEPIRFQEHLVGSIQVAHAMQYSQRTLYNLLEIELGTLLVGIFLALGSGYWLAGLSLRPVSKLTAEVNQMHATDLSQRLQVPDPPIDELDTLAETFNRLFDRLEGAFEMQRQFVADASHELKSPLTAIRGHAQLIAKRGASNPDRLEEWGGTILRESDRLARLVGELLLLAKGDHGIEQLATESVDLALLAKEVVSSLRNVHPQLCEVEAAGSSIVAGSADRLRQVLINLLDNALRATHPNGTVRLQLRSEDSHVILTVEDTGHGISSEHLLRIFDRFYRVDAARDRKGGGTGLGLAIVESIVKSHAGTIVVKSEPDAGTSFILTFPLAPESLRLTTSNGAKS